MREDGFFEHVREPGGWLHTAVVRLAVSRLRRRAVWDRVRAFLHRSPEPSTVELDLRSALRRLPPTQRGAIVLRYYFDASHEEIAKALGLRESSVGRILARGRERLRKELG